MTQDSVCLRERRKAGKTAKEPAQKGSDVIMQDKGLQLDAIIKAFDGLIYLCSQDYRIEFMNKKYIERIGYDATGQICYKALHHRDSVCPWCLVDRILKCIPTIKSNCKKEVTNGNHRR